MAESSERIDEQLPEADGALAEDAGASRRGGLPFWLILAGAAFVAAGLGGYFSYAYYGDIARTLNGSAVPDSLAAEVDQESLRTYGEFSELPDIIINPASSGGQRFLMLNIGLEAKQTKTLEEVTSKEVVVRDTVLKVLGSRSIDELADISKRNELKESLRQAVNSVLRTGEIERLYFTRYVIQ